ncbi:MAG: cell division protein ZapA [Gemmatimonadota bacterium]|nr:cell division protein ZapA [Gemmatimonadota bacterium]MDE3006378.1 cell division protein ZapA [Gemmatimonadota bacterium]MDE3015142.1 cell division protein ZapA [Gemmatimonadota bacterium]
MTEKTSVTVRIAGEEHTIRASAQPDYTRKCAKLVDDRIHEIRLAAGVVDGQKAAILAALSIADEYFQAHEELERAQVELAARVEALAAHVEGALPLP